MIMRNRTKKKPLWRIYIDSKKYWPGLAAVFLFTVLAGVFKTAASLLWGRAVDFGIGGEMRAMLISAAQMVLAILLDGGRTAVLYKIIGHTTEGIFLDLRTRALEKINKGNISILENQFRSGDTAARVNNDIDNLSDFIAGHVSNFLRLIFQGLFAGVACLFLSWQLSLAYFVLLPVSVWAVRKISRPIEMQKKKSMDSTGSAVSFASDAISGILTVKAFGLQGEMGKRFAASADISCEQAMKTEKIGMAMTGIKYATSVIQLMTLFLLGSVLVSNGTVPIGAVLSFISLSTYIEEAFSQLDYMMKTVRSGSAAAERIYEILDIPDEENGGITGGSGEHWVSAENLKFSYGGEEVLKGIDLSVSRGKKIALVGPSGCGKSTLIKLISRFYLPTGGELRFLGGRSADWDREAWRRHLAAVTQEAYLFDGTIYENIAYGKPGITRREVRRVLEEVGLWDFVRSLPEQMDYPIGEFGGRLSGGQRQRICIARAMVKNASLVLLDEATSALDTQSEREVQEALDKLLVGRMAVIAAHRLTTVQSADTIYYLENGRGVEDGSPEELKAKKGKYYQMCRNQGLAGPEVDHG
mgnify:FL=1